MESKEYFENRLEFRKEWSEPIVDCIMEMLKKMRAAGDKYGQMVHRAVDYILDDEDAFRTFLSDGRIDSISPLQRKVLTH